MIETSKEFLMWQKAIVYILNHKNVTRRNLEIDMKIGYVNAYHISNFLYKKGFADFEPSRIGNKNSNVILLTRRGAKIAAAFDIILKEMETRMDRVLDHPARKFKNLVAFKNELNEEGEWYAKNKRSNKRK